MSAIESPGADDRCSHAVAERPAPDPNWLRAARQARTLSWISLAWMTIEGAVGLFAGIVAGIVAGSAGTSGAGKTTLLRCLNFLEKPDTGAITIHDRTVDSSVSGGRRHDRLIRDIRPRTAMIFQHYSRKRTNEHDR
ncbi:ATP-binding cassette domain-containing protein [Actinoallomurus sp. CA-142502]|uniref:ATP-binding cassette domain-containing protein n=1 Tax=Actinoallomurus sp. CA-142502 TaxID=3239885 RepID=UPI003D93475C